MVYNKAIPLYIYTDSFLFRFFSHIDHHRILGSVPSAVQQVLIGQFFHVPQCAYANPRPALHPFLPSSCLLIFLFEFFFHYDFSQEIEQSSLCYTVGPCCLSILYVMICLCYSHTPTPFLSAPSWQPQACSLCP